MRIWLIACLSFTLMGSQDETDNEDWGFLDELEFLFEDSPLPTAHNPTLCLLVNDSGRNLLHITTIFNDYHGAYLFLTAPGNHIYLYKTDDMGKLPEDYVTTTLMQRFFKVAHRYYEVITYSKNG